MVTIDESNTWMKVHVVRVMASGYALLDWIHGGTLGARCTKEQVIKE